LKWQAETNLQEPLTLRPLVQRSSILHVIEAPSLSCPFSSRLEHMNTSNNVKHKKRIEQRGAASDDEPIRFTVAAGEVKPAFSIGSVGSISLTARVAVALRGRISKHLWHCPKGVAKTLGGTVS
jgi:hypothetical protein